MALNFTEDLLQHADELRRSHRDWRFGQTVFNAAHELYPRHADMLRGTPVDPFNRDYLVVNFITALRELVEA